METSLTKYVYRLIVISTEEFVHDNADGKLKTLSQFDRETELEFAPLTIFAGANSSGKSTFIQSILLFAQSLAHKVSSRPIVLNGSFASLGQFDDLKSNDSVIDRIEIKCTCSPILEQEHSDQRRMNLPARPSMYYRRGFSDRTGNYM